MIKLIILFTVISLSINTQVKRLQTPRDPWEERISIEVMQKVKDGKITQEQGFNEYINRSNQLIKGEK